MISPRLGDDETGERVRAYLAMHGLVGATDEHLDAIESAIRYARRVPTARRPALTSRKRLQAIAGVNALLRHLITPPRRAGSTDDARAKVISELDSLHAIVKLAAMSGYNAVAALGRLKENKQTPKDLFELRNALNAMTQGQGAGPPNTSYLPILRAGVLAWEFCGRRERFTYDEISGELSGRLPDFLRALLDIWGGPQPSNVALHRHLRTLKNL